MGKRLFVRNISSTVDSLTLEDMFNSVGDVELVEFDPDKRGANGSLGAYVQMQSEQAARDCIDRFNGFQKDGLALIVTEDVPHRPDPNHITPKRRKALAAKKEARCKTPKVAART